MSLARIAILGVCLCVHIVTVFGQFGFFPQRDSRREYGFGQNLFPNPRRITQNLAAILHFQPGNPDRNQQYIYPFNNVGISNNRPIYEQRPPDQTNNVRFPQSGRDIPNDYVYFETPNEVNPPATNAEFNSNNGGLISGVNDGGPVFGNNENGGLISGVNDGGPVFGNNDNGGLISGKEDDRPVFAVIEDDGAISSYDGGEPDPPTPVMVVEQPDDGKVPVFGDRNGEEDPTTPVPTTEPKNVNFGGEAVFSETCQTVDGGTGSCISIVSCPQYVKLLRQAQTNPEAVKVLRGAHCGFEGNNPKVCCPKQGIPDVPPPRPQPQPQPSAAPKTAGDFLSGLPQPPVCGVSAASFSRVVGGINATLGDFPWMALLGYKSKRDGSTRWLCGGSLVSPRHVMTAAHCIHNHEEDLYLVRLGELDLARDDEGATPIDVIIKSKVKHEGYDPKSFINDIGILLLEREVQFTDLIKPICIPNSPELRARSFEDYNPIIAGWGDTEFRGPAATLLQVLQLPVVSNEFCAQAYSQYTAQVIDKRVLCAGFKKGGKDACQGDSGGPLMQPIWNSETYKTYFYQIGVVSYGKRCAEAGFPGVYTRVTEFVPWIQKNLLGSS